MNPPILHVDNLHKTFKTGFLMRPVKILHGISLQVQSGEIFGFLGPNGAGKTTTIKAICNFISYEQGIVNVFGGDFSQPEIRNQVGIMPEHAYYHDFLSAREFLHYHGALSGLAKQDVENRIEQLLPMVGMEQYADRLLSKFSKGMLQRIGLAQALIADPQFLILDEPMGGLDPIGRREVRDILIALKKQGKTIFFSTHILPDVEQICDRIVVIKQGRTLKTGNLHDFLNVNVQNVEVWFHGNSTKSIQQLPEIQVLSDSNDQLQHIVVNQDDLGTLLGTLKHENIAVQRIETQRKTLEDVFMGLMNNDD